MTEKKIITFVLVALLAGCTPSEKNQIDMICDIVDETRDAYSNAKSAGNDIKTNQAELEARLDRKDRLLALMPVGEIKPVSLKIVEVSSFLGKVSMELDLGCDATLKTQSYKLDSDQGKALASYNNGSFAAVSGYLVETTEGSKDAFFELSITESGGMEEPVFSFEILKITPTK